MCANDYMCEMQTSKLIVTNLKGLLTSLNKFLLILSPPKASSSTKGSQKFIMAKFKHRILKSHSLPLTLFMHLITV